MPIDLFVLRPYLSAISLIGFYVYFDERVLILLMVDEWGLLMVAGFNLEVLVKPCTS